MIGLDFPIEGAGPMAEAVRAQGYRSFAAVAEAIRALPYGRLSDPTSIVAVLKEQKGTCGTKHRLLAALAHECGHPEVKLMIGLYEMSEANTPGVGGVLAPEGLSAIPEAHCYLMRGGQRFDFTGLAAGTSSPFDALIEERAVSPGELPSAKPAFHRQALTAWARARGLDPERIWNIRERCIAALSDRTR